MCDRSRGLASVISYCGVVVTVSILAARVPRRGDEDIFPDPMARQVYSAWRQDHKAVERQFAAM